jgi:hypothetical protein
MVTLMLSEEGTAFEIEYSSVEEYRERMEHAWVKMEQSWVGRTQVIVNNGQSVFFPNHW